jgi:molybdopterin-guanine dinucleotide biosynthesis protein A
MVGAGYSFPLYLLAGGRNSRFGRDKARALHGEEPMIIRAASSLAAVTRQVTVVSDVVGKYDDLGLGTIADLRGNSGPAGGLETALIHALMDDWVLVSSCDLLGLRPEWIEQLASARREGSRVVAFRGERWQPFPALVHRQLRPIVTAALNGGRRALWQIFEATDHVALPLPADWSAVADVNDQATLRRISK